jgi:hypothetical protein
MFTGRGAEFFYLGSRVKKIPDRIRIKEFQYFLPQKLFLRYRKNYLIWDVHPGTRIADPDSDFFHPGPRGQKAPDTGSRSATLNF